MLLCFRYKFCALKFLLKTKIDNSVKIFITKIFNFVTIILRGFMFTAKRRIEFGMCDAAGILFFANIFKLMHSVYEEFIISGKLENNYFNHNYIAVPLVNATADYYKPIDMHEIIDVQVLVENIGDSSFKLKTEFYSKKKELKAVVKTTHVFIDKRNMKKRKISDDFLEMLKDNKG